MRKLLAALLTLWAVPAFADIQYTQGSGTIIFDFVCFTSKHCTTHVPINSAGTEIFTSSNPAQVSIANTGANSTAIKTDGSAVTQPISGTVAATQSGNWTARIQDGAGNALTSANRGAERPLSVQIIDASGNQITSFGGSGGTASNVGSAFPAQGTAVGFSDGTNMQGARVFDLDSTGGTQYVQGVNLRATGSGGSTEIGVAAAPLQVSLANTGANTTAVKTDGSAVTQPVSGTVTANQGGTWTVQPGNTANTTPWLASINDGTNTAKVLGASTQAAATDKSLVVQINPNQPALTSAQPGQFVSIGPIGSATAVDQNSGNKSAGTQRVAIATDDVAHAAWGQVATGSAPPASAVYLGANASGATGGLVRGMITCDSYAKYDASTSGSTQIITGVASRKVYICGFLPNVGGTATNVKLVEGTGTNCATGAADVTPAFQIGANGSTGFWSPFWSGVVTATNADNVCINASAANAVQAIVSYTIL